MEAVLREGGDTVTTVPSARTRSEYSAFGQADWSIDEQVRFAAKLPCLAQSESVTSLMGQISYGQRWGLGIWTAPNSRAAGGPIPAETIWSGSSG
ncbi:hypothetical protein [Nocardia crassostreae]|uniref:hypothetical protein n=1 Tax=Nocardia crassostreae TaxID=53428 RepID=UPI0008295018|nr:hypothetical protein [Nocardia crassostreae]